MKKLMMLAAVAAVAGAMTGCKSIEVERHAQSLATIKNADAGKVDFGKAHFTPEMIGNTYTYEVTEVNDGQSGITYDTHKITYTVKVTEKGAEWKAVGSTTYKNKTKTTNRRSSGGSSRSSLAKTGDPTSLASVAALAVAGAATLGYGVRRRRRQQ